MGLQVQWAYPEHFGEDFILRLEGMELLISHVGAVGVLTAGSGLEELTKQLLGMQQKCSQGRVFSRTLEY